MISAEVAAVAVSRLFSGVAPRGRGPLEVRNLYRLWRGTGLRREDLTRAIQHLVDKGSMRAEHVSGACQYFLVRRPLPASRNLSAASAELRAIDSVLAAAAARVHHGESEPPADRRAGQAPSGRGSAERRGAQQNRLLAALSASDQSELQRHLELVSLEQGQLLWQRGDRLRYAYFPVDCIVSALLEMSDGASCEAALVGNEGLIDVSVLLGEDTAMKSGRVHKAGFALRIAVHALRQIFDRNAAVRSLLLNYIRALLNEVSQGAACNRHHPVGQQVSRLLLSSIDRMRSMRLQVTHEAIANMLGVRREGVTQALGKLRKAGVISCERGTIEVRDRGLLRQTSCECYETVRDEYERLRPQAEGPVRNAVAGTMRHPGRRLTPAEAAGVQPESLD